MLRKILSRLLPNFVKRSIRGRLKGRLRDLSFLERMTLRSDLAEIQPIDYREKEILIHVDSQVEYETRIYSCQKEPDTVAWIETMHRPGEIFFDIGANIGAYTLISSARGSKVYAFEPGFANFHQLCRNIVLNRLDAVPLQVALAGAVKVDFFNYTSLESGGALHVLGQAIDFKGDTFEPVFRQPVLALSMDALIETFRLPVPNHVKIDVDSIEFDILQGGSKTLENPSLRTLLVEINEDSNEPEAIKSFLADRGLNFRSRQCNAEGHPVFGKSANYIFIRE